MSTISASTLGPSHPQLLLTQLVIGLALATLLDQLCRRYLRAPVVGELLAGVLLALSLLGWLPSVAVRWLTPAAAAGPDVLFNGFTQFAVVLLVGVTGARIDLPALHRDRAVVFIGVAMCVSAIPVIAITLRELDLLHRRIGQLILAAASLDDLAGWLILSVLSAMVEVRGPHPVLLAVAALLALLALVGPPPSRKRVTVSESLTARSSRS